MIRHGLTDAVGHRITGRLPGLHLNSTGRAQAERLPDRLAAWQIDAIYSSPLERTVETATPTAKHLGLEVHTDISFAEFDFGDWSGELLSDLDKRDDWKLFNQFRSGTRAPGGELITEVQTRMVSALSRLRSEHPNQTVAVFSHADAIKALLMHYLAIPLDHIQRLEIQPVSISVVRLEPWGPVIGSINLTS